MRTEHGRRGGRARAVTWLTAVRAFRGKDADRIALAFASARQGEHREVGGGPKELRGGAHRFPYRTASGGSWAPISNAAGHRRCSAMRKPRRLTGDSADNFLDLYFS